MSHYDRTAVPVEEDDVSSDVTSLAPPTPTRVGGTRTRVRHREREMADGDGDGELVATARRLIVELQAMLPEDIGNAGSRNAGAVEVVKTAADRATAASRLEERRRQSAHRPPSAPLKQPQPSQQLQQQQKQQKQPSPPTTALLELQACNGLCVVFANYSGFLPGVDGGEDDAPPCAAAPDSDDHRQRAGQIRDAAASVGQLFNSRLEFTVLIHWNKSRSETLQLLSQAAAMMADNRDCCFAFFLGRGGAEHFEAASGGSVPLADILATLAVGQRARLPVFVVGELALLSPPEPVATGRPNLPGNQLLLWTLGVPQAIELLVNQLTQSHLSGSRDVATTVAGIAQWIRRRRGRNADGVANGCRGGRSCRFLSKLDQLVYLASPDCI